ncbi:hypothetical protein CRUP_001699 [Coryphaenoides rupestris]|nr:hypothetical protein CRUP_001699 [Coryphaenoides rupestris]
MFCVGGSDVYDGRQGVSAPIPRPLRPPGPLRASPLSRWSAVFLSVCLLLPQLIPAALGSAVCPAGCLCGADLLSCAAMGHGGHDDYDQDREVPRGMPASTVMLDLSHNRIARLERGAFAGLPRLETLRLNHNQMTDIEPGAFLNSSGAVLRHLDLSSNHLRLLEVHYFLELPGLEELLLFNNRITRVESHALTGLGSLRKAYFSHNRLTNFPFSSIQEHSHPHLTMLDLSSNRLPRLPIQDIANLPLAVQSGLYLHNNSLECGCSMYGLFRHWEQRGYASVKHFRHEHTCLVYGIQRGTVRFFQHARYFENCSAAAKQVHLQGHQESDVLSSANARVALNCATVLRGRHVNFIWVTPNQEYVAPPGNNGSLQMFDNGTLVIRAVTSEDSGVYWCMARDKSGRRNETREVNVTVAVKDDDDGLEGFNTGFTTLLGCMVTLVLVLMYLYLTPCRCPPWRKVTSPPTTTTITSPGNDPTTTATGSGQSSILSPTPPATTEGPGRRVSAHKHVVFLEPIKEQQNGRLRLSSGAVAGHGGHLGPGMLLEAEHQASKPHGQAQQRAGETDSIRSVFSDTPIISP